MLLPANGADHMLQKLHAAPQSLFVPLFLRRRSQAGMIASLFGPLKEEVESRFHLPFLNILLNENEIGEIQST